MNKLPLELIYESFRFIDKNHVITCTSITKLLIFVRKLIHVQICLHKPSPTYGFVSSNYTIENSFFLYKFIHHKVRIELFDYRSKIYLNNDKIRHLTFKYFYKNENNSLIFQIKLKSLTFFNYLYKNEHDPDRHQDTSFHENTHDMLIFPKKLKSLIHIDNLNPLKIETSHLEYLFCHTITNKTSHLFPKLKYLVIRDLPDKLPLSLKVLSLNNSQLTSHIDISYLVNVTKLFLEKQMILTYPPHLKYLKINTVSSQTLKLPNSLETLIVKRQPQPITQELILHFPESLTKIKVRYLHFKTHEAKQNFTNSNLKTIIVTGSDQTKFPELPKKLETLNSIVSQPLPQSLRTLGSYFSEITTIQKSQITRLQIRILSPSITDFSKMRLQRLRVFCTVEGLPDYTIILPSSLQILSLDHIASSIKIVDNGCKLTHLRYYNNYSIMRYDISDLLNLLKMSSLTHTYYFGNYDTNLAFSPNLEYFKILFQTNHAYIITKELFPKLKKLSMPPVTNQLHEMTFPKSLRSIQISVNGLKYVPKSIKYIIICR